MPWRSAIQPQHVVRRRLIRVLACGDVALTAIAMSVGLASRSTTLWGASSTEEAWVRFTVEAVLGVLLLVLWNVGLWVQGTRRFDVLNSGAREYQRLTYVALVMFGLVITVSYSFKLEIARGFVLVTFPLGWALLCIWRAAFHTFVTRRATRTRYRPRAVVVDAAQTLDEVTERALRQVPAMDVVSTLGLDEPMQQLGDIGYELAEHDADYLYLGPSLAAVPGFLTELAWLLSGSEIRVIVGTRLMDRQEPTFTVTSILGGRHLVMNEPELDAAQRFQKRALDLVITVPAMFVLLPLILLLALLVKLTSRGPAFYGQERVGLKGETFTMLKLRTMVQHADELLPELLAQNEAAGPLFKMAHDPRITRFGRFLRKFSLDELPQFFNVLVNDMTLVGPRPSLPSEVAQYETVERRRLMAKPGLTGLWQISGRAHLTWEEALGADIEYIYNWSMWLDIWIMLMTVPEVVFGRGE